MTYPGGVVTDLDQEKPVCVIGASGFIAAFVVRDLLARGWKVHGTVRDPEAKAKTAPLEQLPRAECGLRLFAADLTAGDSSVFEKALEGCVACIHTATPINAPAHSNQPPPVATWEEHEEKQAGPALAGTKLVLEACAKVGVRRVVLTSSFAAVRFCSPEPSLFDESVWSNEEFLRSALYEKPMASYALAKTQQEKLAWDMANQLKLQLRVIVPGFVLGPVLTQHVNFSHEVFCNVLKGFGTPLAPTATSPQSIQNGCMNIVDVREVASAHILAMEQADAEGRYVVIADMPHISDILTFVRDRFPNIGEQAPACDWPIDGSNDMSFEKMKPLPLCDKKVRGLGVVGIPWKDLVEESVHALGNLGLVSLDSVSAKRQRVAES